MNNFSEKIVDNKLTKNFQFVFESYVDTSEINGKPFIPFFIRENISKVYYRKNPDSQKEYILGTKMSGHLNRLDSDGIGHFMKKLEEWRLKLESINNVDFWQDMVRSKRFRLFRYTLPLTLVPTLLL